VFERPSHWYIDKDKSFIATIDVNDIPF